MKWDRMSVYKYCGAVPHYLLVPSSILSRGYGSDVYYGGATTDPMLRVGLTTSVGPSDIHVGLDAS